MIIFQNEIWKSVFLLHTMTAKIGWKFNLSNKKHVKNIKLKNENP